MASFRDRQVIPGGERTSEDGVFDERFAGAHPAIHEYLTVPMDGPSRGSQTATLLVFAEDGLFKVCLNDRSIGCSTFAAGAGIYEALLCLEERLSSGTAEWRKAKRRR